MPKESWLILANGGCMKLFRFPSNTRKLTEAETIYNVERHEKLSDINSDKSGRTHQSMGRQSSAYEQHKDLKKIEQEHFADQIADKLHRAALKNSYDRLYLAISKEFYGILKPRLSKEVLARIFEHTEKDLTHEKLSGIWDHFPSRR